MIAAIQATSFHEALLNFWPVAAVSFVVALLATPVCRWIALRRGIVDRPDNFLKPHERPIAYLGGVAVFAGWLAGILTSLLSSHMTVRCGFMLEIALAGAAIMLVGLFDDLHVMSPRVKLACNLLVGAWLLYVGLGTQLVRVATDCIHVTFPPEHRWLELAYSVPVALLIVVGACNAANLIDGMDGLCAGVLGLCALGYLILAIYLLSLAPQSELSTERVVISLAILGGALGFLPFNFNPARIFLGDAGSMLLGLNAAILILMFGQVYVTRWMMGALMVFGLPCADTALTLMRRWRNGKPLMQGDRSHFYDQLRDRGLSVRQVVMISYALTCLFAALGVSVIFLRTRYVVLVYGVTVVAIAMAIGRFKLVNIERERVPAPSTGLHHEA